MSELLECFRLAAPYINDISTNDICVAVSDLERYIAAVESESIKNVNIKPGDPVPENTVLMQAIRKGHRVMQRASAELLGVPYVACAIPIIENGVTVGGVTFLLTIDKQEHMIETASEVSAHLQQVSASSSLIAQESDSLVSIYNEMSGLSSGLGNYIRETDDVLRLIENFSRQTNLLGLNASVEAARVGNLGKGFGIIAGETRKLAAEITTSIKQIEEIFEVMKEVSVEQSGVIKKIDTIIDAQSESIKRVNENIQSLNAVVEELVSDAEKLIE